MASFDPNPDESDWSAATGGWDGDESRPRAASAPIAPTSSAAARALAPGTLVGGRYRVRRTLGVGGFGVVYEAEHVDLGRRVALKLLRRELTENEQIVSRFEQEARAAAAIGHPNIVEVFDLGRAPEGGFIAMELLEGEELADRIARAHPLPEAFVARVGAEVADAMAAAHERGVVHRDLKPQNVFLTRQGRAVDRVKVIDFGIAKLLHRVEGELTQTGQVFGTPRYMAPEQLRGAKDMDARVDVYAVGAILFHALTGEAPFDAETYAELVLKVVTEPVPPIARRRPDVTPAMCEIVTRALAKDPNDRFATARELADALFAHAEAAPTRAPSSSGELPISSGTRVSSGVQPRAALGPAAVSRSRAPIIMLAAALTAALGALAFVVVFFGAGQAPERPANAVPAPASAPTPATQEVSAPAPAATEEVGAPAPAARAPEPPAAPAPLTDYASLVAASDGGAVQLSGAVLHRMPEERAVMLLWLGDACAEEACPVWVQLSSEQPLPPQGAGLALSGVRAGTRTYAAQGGDRRVPAVLATELRPAPHLELGSSVVSSLRPRAPRAESERRRIPATSPLPMLPQPMQPSAPARPATPRRMYEDEI
jgi:predicted Ser/Thr protein kinase